MKQETTNVFQAGLNYDLNPLVTPNNVLTDAVNGTFITYNGNELSLQNDAGNTVINIKSSNKQIVPFVINTVYSVGDVVSTTDNVNRIRCFECVVSTSGDTLQTPIDNPRWREYLVRLTEGFYPLAVKEYGGVLYIISAKNVFKMATDYNPETVYSKGDIVFVAGNDVGGIVGMYYESKIYNNDGNNLSNPDWWTPLGGKYDESIEGYLSASNFNEIEFGSYPSPEKYTLGDEATYSADINAKQLYNPKLITDVVFRPGEAVSFTSTLDSDYISPITGSDLVRFYKVKLLQQLTSGYADLTEGTGGVNTAFETWVAESSSTYTHWLFDPDFKYYCPYLYKGKLVASLEIEDLQSYEITLPENSVIFTDTYSVTINTEATFIDNIYTIKVDNFIVSATIDGVDIPTEDIDITIDISTSEKVTATIIFSNIAAENKGKTLNYSIIPHFIWDGNSDGNVDLPTYYISKYTNTGSIILLGDIASINLIKTNDVLNSMCSLDNSGWRIYDTLILQNEYNDPINLDFKTILIGNGLKRTDSNGMLTNPYGYYHLDTGTHKAVFDGWDPIWGVGGTEENKAKIVDLVNQTIVEELDDTCVMAELKVVISGSSDVVVTLDQGGDDYSSPYNLTGAKQFTEMIYNSPIQITITPIDPSYETYTTILSGPGIYNFILVAKLELIQQGVDYNFNYFLQWTNSIELPDTGMTVKYFDAFNELLQYPSVFGYVTDLNINAFLKGTAGEPNDFLPNTYSSYNFTDAGTTISNIYHNIPNIADYININGIIFHRSGS